MEYEEGDIMATFRELKFVRNLSERGDTNSQVDLFQENGTDNFIVRKTIYGIDIPLYQAIFIREVRALYKLNKCESIVRILGHDNLKIVKTGEKVGVIYLENITGVPLSKAVIQNLSSKEKFIIVQQIIEAITISHSNGIIHRDINPNNIMLSEDKSVKVIDYGICKIKDMINAATVYALGTNAYSAPEVHLHSENATEKSDLYSFGAVIYFLFTGKQPPLANEFQEILDSTSGIDIELKPIIKKLVAERVDDRYEDIYEVRNEFKNLFIRFLDIQKNVIFSMGYENYNKLKYQKLIPSSIGIREASDEYLPNNFAELYAFCKEDSDDEILFTFVGFNYTMDCVYDETLNIFYVKDFQKVVPYLRERLKRKYTPLGVNVIFIDKKYAYRQQKNDSFEIHNVILDFYNEYLSKNNVDYEYKNNYGVWKELLSLIKENIEKNIVRLQYDSYKQKGDIIRFVLHAGTFVDEDRLTKEQNFVYEKKLRGKGDKVKALLIGNYENDSFDNENVILEIRRQGTINLPAKGYICLDYTKDMVNVDRQIDALNVLEKEDYQCPFSLKRVIAGVDKPTVQQLTKEIHPYNKKLDFPQTTAVQKALNAESIAIIQGPPGTGKTNVIIEIIRQILKENDRNVELEPKKILLVSQSHPAVDKMIEDLIRDCNKQPDLLRIGRDEKLNEEVREDYALSYVKEKWVKRVRENCEQYANNLLSEIGIEKGEFDQYYQEKEKGKIANERRENIDKEYIRKFEEKTSGIKSERIRKILEIQKEWTEQIARCEETELYIIKSTIIIAGTCTGFISNKIIKGVNFDYVIVDEAAKATFPELAVSLNKAHKIILVGDHQQLPPVLDTDIIYANSDKLDEEKLAHGIFEKLYDMFPDENKHRLTIQYRMHPTIGTLISHVFYDDEIQNGIEALERQLNIPGYEDVAIEWISTSSRTEKERYEKEYKSGGRKSYKNDLERKIIKQKLLELDKKINKKIKVAVITAYSPQKYIISTMVKQLSFQNLSVEVDTVDAFQGSQKDIIIYSTVRSSDNPHKIGFLKSAARLNVAFSRARCLLIIVGDLNFLDNDKIRPKKFFEIADYIKNHNNCRIVEY